MTRCIAVVSAWDASSLTRCSFQDQGVRLASNQVQYSLLYRAPEQNGVLKACQELGVTLIAYSPLCQGLLTGDTTLFVLKALLMF